MVVENAVMPAAEFVTYITAELTKWRDVVITGIPINRTRDSGADVIFSFLFFLEDGVHRLNLRFALTLHNHHDVKSFSDPRHVNRAFS